MTISRYRSGSAWALLSAGFRPFFLLAGLWACSSMAIWTLMLRGTIELPTAFSPVMWHFHELLFGFVTAAIAGFLLTAVPNWTGRLPLEGWSLGLLVSLWILGRLAMAFSAYIGPLAAMVVDLSFLIVLSGVIAREIFAGTNWRNLPVIAAVTLLVVANAMIHAGAFGHISLEAAGMRLALSIVVVLISLIGGRIIPSFTTNWLRRRGAQRLPSPFGPFDKLTLATNVIALAGWVVLELHTVSALALIVAGVLNAVRLARWRGSATVGEPLLWIMHLAYAWLPIGFILLGSSTWRSSLGTAAIHTLTAGAMGTMILAVMTRASLGHSKRELTAGYGTLAVYILVLLAGTARIAAQFANSAYSLLLEVAGSAWIAAFLLFVILYFPLYVRRT